MVEDAMKTKLRRLIVVGAQSFGTLRLSRSPAARHVGQEAEFLLRAWHDYFGD
jgi:hypothetical protein